MRNLLVNNEDLLRMNTQLQAELKRMRDRIVELESDNNVMVERFKQIDVRSAAFSSVRAMLVWNKTIWISHSSLNRLVLYSTEHTHVCIQGTVHHSCAQLHTLYQSHGSLICVCVCLFCRWNWKRPEKLWWKQTRRNTPLTSCNSHSKTEYKMQRFVY